MTADAQAEAPPGMLVKAALVAPPIAVIAGSFVLAEMSAAAWGAGHLADYPDWVPTTLGLIVAVPTVVIALALIWSLASAMRYRVAISGRTMPMAIVGFAAHIGIEILIGTRLGIEDAYLDNEGKQLVSPEAAVGWSLVVSTGLMMALVVACGLYKGGVQSDRGMRFAKRGDEPDAIGALIREDDRQTAQRPGADGGR